MSARHLPRPGCESTGVGELVAAAIAWRQHELARQPSKIPGVADARTARMTWQRRNLDFIVALWRAIDAVIDAPPEPSHDVWANAETAAVAQHIGADGRARDLTLETVRRILLLAERYGDDPQAALAAELRARAFLLATSIDTEDHSFAHALAAASLERVNWTELALHYTAKAQDGSA